MRVLENWALKKIFGHEKGEVTEELRRLHDEALHCLCPSNIIRVMKSGRIKMGEAQVLGRSGGGEERCIQGFGRET
jgi:hypothetical protein